jgi:hypothetical protein
MSDAEIIHRRGMDVAIAPMSRAAWRSRDWRRLMGASGRSYTGETELRIEN